MKNSPQNTSTFAPEKRLHQQGAVVFQDTHFEFGFGMQQGFAAVEHETAFFIGSAVHHPPDLRPGQRAGAHDAGLECDEQGAIGQVLAAQMARGGREGQYFSVGCHVGQLFGLVVRPGDDAVVAYDDGAHGYFTGLVGFLRLGQGLLHEVGVGVDGEHDGAKVCFRSEIAISSLLIFF